MKDFVELLKMPPSILAAVSLGLGLVLFLPYSILVKLGLDNIAPLWRIIIGVAFVISTSLLAIYAVLKIFRIALSKFRFLCFRLKFPSIMRNLRKEERKIVTLLYCSPNYTSYLPSSDGITVRLKSKMIIQLTSSSSIAIGDKMSIPHTITPIAQNYIDKHQEFIREFDHNEMQKIYSELNDPLYM